MLRWVLSVLGVVSGAGCKRGEEAKEYDFRLPLTEEIYTALGVSDPMMVAHAYTFAPPLRIAKRDEPVDATAYVALTMPDGTAVTGKFALKATLRKGYTGGPAGSATEMFVHVEDVRLVEKLKPPPAPPGVKALLPGQGIIRKIPPGGVATLDDRYVLELPANMPAEVWLLPERDRYDLDVTVTKDSVALPTVRQPEGGTLYQLNSYQFQTAGAGIYEIRVRPDKRSALEPDSYMICVGFGWNLWFGSKEIGGHKVILRQPDANPVPVHRER